MDAVVLTVAGPVPAADIGFTLPHEHLSCSLERVHLRQQAFDFSCDADLISEELDAFRAGGGECVVDLTPPGLGRDARWLQSLSARTGLHVVMAAGWYRDSFYPPGADIDRRSIDSLTDELVAEAEAGVEGTGVRPGIIGEIGTDGARISPREEKVHRAAARAASRTGLAVVTHSLGSKVGLTQLAVFEEEGLEPARVVIGHADSVPDLGYYDAILDRGASLSFDLFGLRDREADVREATGIQSIVALLERGFADRIMLSQDVCSNAQLRRYGGNGYGYLTVRVLPWLRDRGVEEPEIERMTVANPRHLLTVSI
jgi:phosphotriesterase-related protein